MHELDYEPQWKELATAVLTQAYQDYAGIPVYKHVCVKCWKPWETTVRESPCPRCGKVNVKPDFKGYRPYSDVREFLNSGWCVGLCDYVGVSHSEYKRRVLRYAKSNRIERG